jgi:hypothetical protein
MAELRAREGPRFDALRPATGHDSSAIRLRYWLRDARKVKTQLVGKPLIAGGPYVATIEFRLKLERVARLKRNPRATPRFLLTLTAVNRAWHAGAITLLDDFDAR